MAILDALGAKNYSEAEIENFLSSRDRLLDELNAWVEVPHGAVQLQDNDVITFTFNDTIIIVLRGVDGRLSFDEVTSFAGLLRKFIADSLASGLLFRGAAALGSFRVDEDSNTVMGDAVTDAAQWYESSEWVGVHFTPRSCLELSSMYEATSSGRRWAMFCYDVPLRNGGTLNAYAINWPKILMVPRLSPWKDLQQHAPGCCRVYLNTEFRWVQSGSTSIRWHSSITLKNWKARSKTRTLKEACPRSRTSPYLERPDGEERGVTGYRSSFVRFVRSNVSTVPGSSAHWIQWRRL